MSLAIADTSTRWARKLSDTDPGTRRAGRRSRCDDKEFASKRSTILPPDVNSAIAPFASCTCAPSQAKYFDAMACRRSGTRFRDRGRSNVERCRGRLTG